jgi:putative ABC transport system permease protein
MPILPQFRSLWRNLIHKDQVERELAEEIRAYRDLLIEEKLKAGLTPGEARRLALIELGGEEQLKEKCRDIRRTRVVETLWRDLQYAFRLLWKRPGFTLIATVTLALGIGANSAIFSVVNALLLRPLPYKDANRLVLLTRLDPQRQTPSTSDSIPKFNAIREQNQVFESLAAVAEDSFNLTGRDTPEQIRGARVSGDLLHVLAVQPYLGRNFLPEEDRPGGARVAMLSYNLWRRLFDADLNVVNRTIELDGQSFAVVGILPAGFTFLDEKFEVWLPRAFEPSYFASDSIRLGATYLSVVGRLKPGVELDQAHSELATLSTRYRQDNPLNSDIAGDSSIMPLQQVVVGEIRKSLLVTFGIVGLVLLIACANVMNLLLVRASARRREFAVRTALGASRIQLIRQLVTESLLLFFLGGAGGVLIAYLGITLLVSLKPGAVPRLDEIGLDAGVLGFTLAVSLVTGLIFGLAPALQCSEIDLNEGLKEGGRSGRGNARGNRIHRALVVGEIAIAVIVLVCAVLLARSFLLLRDSNAGLDYHNILTMALTLPPTRYAESYQQTKFYDQMIERVRSLPGVTNVAITSTLPLLGSSGHFRVYIEGVPDPGSEKVPRVPGRSVSSDYFRLLKIPLAAGRTFTEADGDKSAKVAVINESFGRRFWPGENPLGKKFAYSTNRILCEVVGVVKDTKFRLADTETRDEMYFPASQRPRLSMSMMVRSSTAPSSLTTAIQNEVFSLDKDQAVTEVETLEQAVGDSIEQPRLTMLLLTIFGLVSVTLAAIGIYGVMAYSVAQRTHEIGIRMALGARPLDVLRLVVTKGMTLALVGIVAGLVAAFVLTRWMASLLFEVTPTDATTYVTVSAGLLAVALLASFIPARRATRVEVLAALRDE